LVSVAGVGALRQTLLSVIRGRSLCWNYEASACVGGGWGYEVDAGVGAMRPVW
jgi:hypothetical protein